GGCRKVTTLGIMNNFLLVDATDILLEEDVFKWNLSTQRWDGFVTYFPEGPDYIDVFASDGINLYMGGSFTNFEGENGDYIVRLEDPIISSTNGKNSNGYTSLQVFPNPTEDIIQFEFEDCHSGSHLVTMTDATGSTVLKKETEDCTVDISSLGAGMYFIIVDNNVHRSVGKITIQR
ncbi:MAG TPA: T9SS type A sorting domain-containing protein, partial [Saprospiraceae bacterium]